MQDILGDGGIFKKVIQPGGGPPVPRDSSVTGNLHGRNRLLDNKKVSRMAEYCFVVI